MAETSRYVILLGSFFLSFSLVSSSTFAQTPDTSLRLITSPLPVSLIAEPGESITTELKVKNAGTGEERLKIQIFKFKAFEENGAPRILDPEPGDDFIHWVTFSDPTFTLAPEEWKTITATIALPATASFGYYYAFVFTRMEDETLLGERQTAVVGGTATLVLLEARVPNAKREVIVNEFSTKRKVYEFLPATFTVKLRNSGNVHIAPRGNIFIERGSDKNVALIELNPEKGNILPDSNRNFEETWADGFPVYTQQTEDGKVLLDEGGQPETELSWNWKDSSKLRFGFYTAKMLLVYDDGNRDIPIEGTVSFWVVPWRLVAGALFIAIFFFLGMKNSLLRAWHKLRLFFVKPKAEES